MFYPAKILKNPTDKDIELTACGRVHLFKAGEERPVDGEVAYQILNFLHNHKLVDMTDGKILKKKDELRDMPWKQLLQKAGKRYKMGMKREDVIEMLKND